MAILYALCCLFFAALNDIVFKLFAREDRSRGMFVFWIGLVSCLAMAGLRPDPASDLQVTLIWGLIAGFLSVTANFLLIEAMGMQSAGVCSTIFRLNLVLVVPGAMVLFGERLSPMQGIGIFAALAAILAFMPGKEERQTNLSQKALLGFYLVLMAAILRASMGLAYKYGFAHGADKNLVALINTGMWIIGGLIYAFFKEKQLSFRQKDVIKFGAVSGLLVAGIIFFTAAMLQVPDGAASIVLPIAQMSFLLTFLLSAVFLKEKVTKKKIAALLCGCVAILLLVL